MREGGFNLRKWKSSNTGLQKEFKFERQANSESGESYAKEALGVATQDGKTKVLSSSRSTERRF